MVVVGAGVTGLTVAHELLLRWPELKLLARDSFLEATGQARSE